jgi:hypothetical protein
MGNDERENGIECDMTWEKENVTRLLRTGPSCTAKIIFRLLSTRDYNNTVFTKQLGYCRLACY